MKINKITILSLFTISASIYAADPVTLNISGNIVASPCLISSDSVSKSIDLGQSIQASDLQTAGQSTPWTNFTINLSSCPAGTTVAIMTMHGTADTFNPNDMYQNIGTAQNIAVQLQSQSTTPLGNGKSISGTIVSNAYSYALRARAYTQSGGVTPGTIVSVVTASFVYN